MNKKYLEPTDPIDSEEPDEDQYEELDENEYEEPEEDKKGSSMELINRVFGFVLSTCIVLGIALLSIEFVLVKGPSPSLRDMFVMTMLETRRFGFVANIFLSDAEVQEIQSRHNTASVQQTDTSLITIPGEEGESGKVNDYNLVDEDGDGIILEPIKKKVFSGYMLIVLDPTRIIVGQPDNYGGTGMTLESMCNKYGTIGGINAGGFLDQSGTGLGGIPAGLTIVDGVYYNEDEYSNNFVGFDADGIMHVGYFSASDARERNIQNGVTFGPALVVNGVAADDESLASGVNPRTAIGQRADGAVLMLVIDGRQLHSYGASYMDLAEIMLEYGAVNAFNLDGGSSTSMYLDGEYVNSCSSSTGVRELPTAFLIR